MLLFNQYVKLAEEEAFERLPDICRKQARLREILHKHPVFRQNFRIDDWFAKGSHPDYIGTGLISKLFTNAYISVGWRTRGCHTDYRNPAVTLLATRIRGEWGNRPITGQTVLFDRYATTAAVIDDNPKGKLLAGGLSGVKHANFGPYGDVKSQKL